MADRMDEVKKLFTSKSARVDTNRGDLYYQRLFEQCRTRLDELRDSPAVNRLDFGSLLEDEGMERRDDLSVDAEATAALRNSGG